MRALAEATEKYLPGPSSSSTRRVLSARSARCSWRPRRLLRWDRRDAADGLIKLHDLVYALTQTTTRTKFPCDRHHSPCVDFPWPFPTSDPQLQLPLMSLAGGAAA